MLLLVQLPITLATAGLHLRRGTLDVIGGLPRSAASQVLHPLWSLEDLRLPSSAYVPTSTVRPMPVQLALHHRGLEICVLWISRCVIELLHRGHQHHDHVMPNGDVLLWKGVDLTNHLV